MRHFIYVLLVGLLVCGLNPVYAAQKFEIVELTGNHVIDKDHPTALATYTAQKKEGVVLSNKLKKKLKNKGLKIRVKFPKQDGVKIAALPSTIKLSFNPDTETFSSASVLLVPTEIDE